MVVVYYNSNMSFRKVAIGVPKGSCESVYGITSTLLDIIMCMHSFVHKSSRIHGDLWFQFRARLWTPEFSDNWMIMHIMKIHSGTIPISTQLRG